MSLEFPWQFAPSKAMNSAERVRVMRERKVVVLKSMVVDCWEVGFWCFGYEEVWLDEEAGFDEDVG
jgi:hypothetical protein